MRYKISALAIAFAIIVVGYLNIEILYSFNRVVIRTEKMKIEFIPDSERTYSGKCWGRPCYTEADTFSVRLIGQLDPSNSAKIVIGKGKETESFTCTPDSTGRCYELLRHPNIMMSGHFSCTVTLSKIAYDCSGTFVRRNKILFIPYNYLMSV